MNEPVYELLKKIILIEHGLDLFHQENTMTVSQYEEMQRAIHDCKTYVRDVWCITQKHLTQGTGDGPYIAHMSIAAINAMVKRHGRIAMEIPMNVPHNACDYGDMFILTYSTHASLPDDENTYAMQEQYTLILYAGTDDEQVFMAPTLEMVLLTGLFENARLNIIIDAAPAVTLEEHGLERTREWITRGKLITR